MEEICNSEEHPKETLELMDIRALYFQVLDGYMLESTVKLIELLDSYFYNDREKEIASLRKLVELCQFWGTGKDMVDRFVRECEGIFGSESFRYINTFLSVYSDYMEIVPHLNITMETIEASRSHPEFIRKSVKTGNTDKTWKKDFIVQLFNMCEDKTRVSYIFQYSDLKESDFHFNSYNEHVCELCGNTIEPGNKAYFRSEPDRKIRHVRCNSIVRMKYEYAFIEYLVKEIKYHEAVFRFAENCDYILNPSTGISLKPHFRCGYVTDRQNRVTRLPHFGEFVLEYISGDEDYELMKKYRPYHVYLELLLKTVGFKNEDLAKMRGYKYLLRETAGQERYPEIYEKICSIPPSELMNDPYIHRMVAKDIIGVIYETALKKIFAEMNMLAGDHTIVMNGQNRTYSINDDDATDISIVIDGEDVYCVDSEKSLSFCDYFGTDSDYVKRMIVYIKQFGADI